MKQLLILSGKGGTGKTSVVASLAKLAKNAVFVDADVDAADLHLLLHPKIQHREDFTSGFVAEIDSERCIACGTCRDLCRFDAIDETFKVDSFSCEGCGLCEWNCPEQAITLKENLSGEWFISETANGPMVHAKLGIAADNSGKLVSLIREKSREVAEEKGRDLILLDGSPGLGCPVIASVSGVDMALLIAEPTPSGLHDLERLLDLLKHFSVPAFVVVNKADLDDTMAEKIEERCAAKGVKSLGRIPFDEAVVKALVAGEALVDYSAGAAAQAVKKIWDRLKLELNLLEN